MRQSKINFETTTYREGCGRIEKIDEGDIRIDISYLKPINLAEGGMYAFLNDSNRKEAIMQMTNKDGNHYTYIYRDNNGNLQIRGVYLIKQEHQYNQIKYPDSYVYLGYQFTD